MKLTVQQREVHAYTGGKVFDPHLPTVVFVHGAMNDHTVFNLLARWFAHHGHSVLALDLPGHMQSQGPALTSVEAMADWLQQCLVAAGVQRTSLVGHSMGSLVVLEAASQVAIKASHALGDGFTVERLIMLGTCVPMPVPQALRDLSQHDVDAAIDRVVTFSFSTWAAKPSFPGPGVWLRGAGRNLMRMVAAHGHDSRLFHTDFTACHNYLNGITAAEQVTCPASLIVGEFDQMTLPRSAKEVADTLMAKTYTVPAGHYLMQEAPDAVLDAMRHALA